MFTYISLYNSFNYETGIQNKSQQTQLNVEAGYVQKYDIQLNDTETNHTHGFTTYQVQLLHF